MISNEQLQKIAEVRAKSQAGTVSLEEYKEAIRIMRGDRIAAASATATRRASTTVASADSLLDDLMGGA
jgi:hypothetical protein